MQPESLLKALTAAGIGSRRKMADAIKQERVAVNGQIVTDFRHPVSPADRITLDGRPLSLKAQQTVTLMLHKPAGVVSTLSDERGRKTVVGLLPEKYRRLRLYPAGRLDEDSTGLLLLTNDGDLAYHLTHPRYEYEKEYLVQIKGKLTPEEKRKLERGVLLDDGMTSPARVQELPLPAYRYSITIHQGRKRQVRRMFAALGHQVTALKRIRMGNITLGDLPEGKTRELSAGEMERFTRRPPPPGSAERSPSASGRSRSRRA